VAAALAWQASLPPADPLPSSGSGGIDSRGEELELGAALRRALRRLQARAVRLQLRSGSGNPARRRAAADPCAAAAAEVRNHIEALQQLVPG
jgi:hypothetical protein